MVVVKIKQVIQIRLQRRTTFILSARGETKTSPDVMTSMLNVFSIDVYALLDPGATLPLFAPVVSKNIDIFPDILTELFTVTTPVGKSVVAKTLYRKCLIMLPNRVTYVKLVELHMFDFDVILGMDWFHACFAFIDCITRLVKFNFPNEFNLE